MSKRNIDKKNNFHILILSNAIFVDNFSYSLTLGLSIIIAYV